MGDHYVPRKYLKGFCKPGKKAKIWAFDRSDGTNFVTDLTNVAQENGFYPPEVEKRLNKYVEEPGYKVLDKLIAGAAVTSEERAIFSLYIATQLYRVPYNRNMLKGQAPALFKETIAEFRQEIARHGEAGNLTPERVENVMEELRSFEERNAGDPAKLIDAKLRDPRPAASTCECIFGMTWRVLTPKGSQGFLTSDNPVFFFGDRGLGNHHSEMSFPLSSGMLLHGCYQPGHNCQRIPITDYLVKEFNRRTISRSTRYLFYHSEQEWVKKIGREQHHNLLEIRWDDGQTNGLLKRQVASAFGM